MEFVFTNQRRSVRRAVRVDCQVVREKDFTLLGDAAINISPDGMLFLSEHPVVPGEALQVSLRVPGTDVWLDTDALVARIDYDDQGRREVGVSFQSLDARSRRLLRTAIAKFPPTLPTRSPRIDYAATAQLIALG